MNFFDFNNPKPSQERRLLANLSDPDKRASFLKDLAGFLAAPVDGGQAEADRTHLMAIRLTAIGVWDEIAFDEMSKATEEATRGRFVAFKKGLPKEIGDKLYSQSKFSILPNKDAPKQAPRTRGYYGAVKVSGSKRDQLIAAYADDLRRKCGMTPDMDLLTKVTIGCGPAIYNADASIVAAGQPAELERVKNNFLVKKLGLADGPELDKAIAKVIKTYGQDERKKYRAVVYYMLVKHFGEIVERRFLPS